MLIVVEGKTVNLVCFSVASSCIQADHFEFVAPNKCVCAASQITLVHGTTTNNASIYCQYTIDGEKNKIFDSHYLAIFAPSQPEPPLLEMNTLTCLLSRHAFEFRPNRAKDVELPTLKFRWRTIDTASQQDEDGWVVEKKEDRAENIMIREKEK